MPPDSDQVRQDQRIAALEHAVFGVGQNGGGMLAELRALRDEIHGLRGELTRLYKTALIAVVSTTGTIIGGVVVFLVSRGGA